jgi:hypothetical protein
MYSGYVALCLKPTPMKFALKLALFPLRTRITPPVKKEQE